MYEGTVRMYRDFLSRYKRRAGAQLECQIYEDPMRMYRYFLSRCKRRVGAQLEHPIYKGTVRMFQDFPYADQEEREPCPDHSSALQRGPQSAP